ncbi:LuxR C-terminal-related transcriptional regulator [Streptomyces sp. NPDC056069]|uniref:LuxR C-terminal-related transcriptional regulator n=1 Tax=Streptomyces sp. NPDC056069 TaxID=3345702 RepID=UPI0035D9B904
MGAVEVSSGQWPLGGRERELAAFEAAWAERRCNGVVIAGPAGVGKSRLAEECLARAANAGFADGGRARASVAASAVPLGAIAHLLPDGPKMSDPRAGFAQVAAVLRTRGGAAGAHRRQGVIYVDDLHLLDATSAVLMRQLLDAGVIRLLATVRSGEPVSDAMDALTGGDTVVWIQLAQFDQVQSGEVLEAALGRPIGPRTLQQLHTASGGNVLYLRELVIGALRTGRLVSDGEIWDMPGGGLAGTPKLAELIGARLDAVDVAARPALELLALCDSVSLADVQAVTSWDLVAALEAAGVIQVRADRRRTTVQLAHPLYGEVLSGQIPPTRRRALLRQQAERIRTFDGRRRDDALHVATWQLAATGTADPDLLIHAAALARHAHDSQQVVELLQALPEERRNLTLLLALGEAMLMMGRWDEAEEVFAGVDPSTLSEPEWIALTLGHTMELVWSNQPPAKALAISEAALTKAVSPQARDILRINDGALRICANRPTEGLSVLETLTSDATEAVDANAWMHGAVAKPVGLALVGRTIEAVAFAEEAYAAHLRVDEEARMVQAPTVHRVPLVLALTEAGRLAEAREMGEQAYALLVPSGVLLRAWMAAFIGRAEWLAGNPLQARKWWAEGAALARSIDHIKVLRLALGGIAACAAQLGDVEGADAALAKLQAVPAVAPGFLSAGEEFLGQAWRHAARGQLAHARQVLREAALTAREARHAASEAMLLTDLARLGGAPEAAGRLAELNDVYDGALAPARAHLAAALAADDPARLLAAAQELKATGADLLAAESATAAAAAWRRAGETRQAAAATRSAQECAARCPGAHTPLLATAEATAAMTTREREIALLAANGTTSKDIATTLHLSVRTVDNHLQHAYSKLGVTTRRELATALGRTSPGTLKR